MIGNIVFFNIQRNMINDHVKEGLLLQMYQMIDDIKNNDINPEKVTFFDDITVEKIKSDTEIEPIISDTVLYNAIQRKFIPHKSLKFSCKYHDDNFLFTLNKSMLSSNKLIERITIASIFMVLSFLFSIYILNRFIFVNVWSNFFKNLREINKYKINSRKKLFLEDSEIDEFNILNSVLSELVEQIQKDFQNLKELTENTSHEVQTPIAVIKSKAEILLQSENLNRSEVELISTIIRTSDRLSKLNQSLLLISKIDNDQFDHTEDLNIREVIEKYIDNFDMLINAGEIEINIEKEDVVININSVLLDILISNMLINAIVHNFKKGKLNISLTNNELEISNTGNKKPLDLDDIFKRFRKLSDNKEGSGLGMEIVEKICNYYGLEIDYRFKDNLHTFTINFNVLIKSE